MRELVLTQDWTLDQIMPYGPQITAAMRKLRDRFPEDGTMESMAKDMMSGAVQLWLMLDEGAFKGIVLTMFKAIEVTGYKAVLVVGCAGEDGVDLCEHIETIETWAKEQGVKSVCPIGRQGWKRPLSKLGYSVDRITYRKDI